MLADGLSGPVFIKVVGLVAGLFTCVSMLPQIIKTIKEKKADDLSVVMILVLMTGLSCWVYYGILRKDLPIIITNSFSIITNIFLLFLRWKYRKKSS